MHITRSDAIEEYLRLFLRNAKESKMLLSYMS